MANARAFSALYDLVGRNCQDESTSGDTLAKEGINETIKELTAEFKFPQILVGFDGSVTITLTAVTGPVTYTLAANVVSVVDIWYILSNVLVPLVEIKSHHDWLAKTSNVTNTSGNPTYWRSIPSDSATAHQVQVWPGPTAAFISNVTNIKYAYFGQLGQLSADTDIPAIPYEHDICLISGGTFYMAQKQGDTTLMQLYAALYERHKSLLRAWVTDTRFSEAVVVQPTEPLMQPTPYRIQRDYGGA